MRKLTRQLGRLVTLTGFVFFSFVLVSAFVTAQGF